MGRRKTITMKPGDIFNTTRNGKIKVIEVNGYNDVTVQFEDGTIASHLYATSVRSGNVAKNHDGKKEKRDHGSLKVERIGEKMKKNENTTLQIIKYRNVGDMDVKVLETGEIIHGVSYRNFKNGNVLTSKPSLKGKTFVNLNGQRMEIIDGKEGDRTVTLKFDDGTIVTDLFFKFVTGKVVNPNFPYVGQTRMSKKGVVYSLVDITDYDNVKIRDIYGNENVVTYRQFLSGEIGLAAKNCHDKYMGMTKIARNGMVMKIIDYKNAHDITVQFEDGTIVKASINNFKSSYVKNPNYTYNPKNKCFKTVVSEDFMDRAGVFVKKMKAEGGLATTSELNGVFTMQEMEIVLAMLKEERIPVVNLDIA